MRREIRNWLLKNKLIIEKQTSPVELENFLRSIRPVITEHDLVRIGGENDGGYLVPDDLNTIEALFSPGVADVATFEKHFADKGIPCFLADYSVEKPPTTNTNFIFTKKFLGNRNSKIFMTLKRWMKNTGVRKGDFILQMDIENSEWDVLPSLSKKQLSQFRIILVEFHDLPSVLFKERSFKMAKKVFHKMMDEFEIVHIHQNNCCETNKLGNSVVPKIAEFTFLRKDRIKNILGHSRLPHPLDAPNVANKKDLPIPGVWAD